nr:hypothetical protein [uncultured Gemmiger sp.]
MEQTKMAAPVLEHRNGRKKRETITKTRLSIVPKFKNFVHNFVVGLGAAGMGLLVGCGLPPLLGLTAFRLAPLLAGFVLVFVGCLEESACFVNWGDHDDA